MNSITRILSGSTSAHDDGDAMLLSTSTASIENEGEAASSAVKVSPRELEVSMIKFYFR